jgi:hypothetical protein
MIMGRFLLILMIISLNLSADLVDDGLKEYDNGNKHKAKELYKKACDGGYISGCLNLGVMYNFGDGVRQDKFKASKLYKKACDGGYVDGCFNLGLMYNNGDAVRQNKPKAKELFGKACDGGDMDGCLNLGVLYVTGDGIRQNKSKAKELFGKVCDGGDMDGCKYYKKLNEIKTTPYRLTSEEVLEKFRKDLYGN